ncbi:hypothetical protein ACFSTC_39330 [Nonomuraea ferruginea]
MADGARRTLDCGVTTVRCVAEKDHADFALRRAIEAGRVPGPRMFTAGRALVCTGGHGHEGTDTLECDGVDGFRRGTRAQLKARRRPHQGDDLRRHRGTARVDRHAPAVRRRDGGGDRDRARLGPQGHRARRAPPP